MSVKSNSITYYGIVDGDNVLLTSAGRPMLWTSVVGAAKYLDHAAGQRVRPVTVSWDDK